MSNLRFFSPDPLHIGQSVTLSDNAATHATKVMRLKQGDVLTLFSGDGFDYQCELTCLEKKSVFAQVLARQAIHSESPLEINLLQGISSGDRMDYTLQKAVELGVRAIYPITCERSVIKLSAERAEKRLEHWQAVVVAACEQSGRAYVPKVHTPMSLVSWISLHHLASPVCRLMLNPTGAKSLAAMTKPAGATIQLLVGPEGGLSPAEIALAEMHQFHSIVLGPRILRTETAALTAVAVMQGLWGDF